MLESIKLALRITTDDFDDQLQECIDFVEKDLLLQGVDVYDEDDIKIIECTKLYAKAVFNWENRGEWYTQQYMKLRNQISLQEGYVL